MTIFSASEEKWVENEILHAKMYFNMPYARHLPNRVAIEKAGGSDNATHCQKGIKRRPVTPQKRRNFSVFARQKQASVKKVRILSPQGLDPGETDAGDQQSEVRFD
jgi:hypothetical protein